MLWLFLCFNDVMGRYVWRRVSGEGATDYKPRCSLARAIYRATHYAQNLYLTNAALDFDLKYYSFTSENAYSLLHGEQRETGHLRKTASGAH
jgi:hypothetical protein